MQIIKEVKLKSMGNKIIQYKLLTNKTYENKIMYGIAVSEKSGDNIIFEEKIEDISNDKSFVLNLINYLSDNAVDTAHFKDVIEDCDVLVR